MSFLDRYPRTKKLLDETGMSVEQALVWSEIEIGKIEKRSKK